MTVEQFLGKDTSCVKRRVAGAEQLLLTAAGAIVLLLNPRLFGVFVMAMMLSLLVVGRVDHRPWFLSAATTRWRIATVIQWAAIMVWSVVYIVNGPGRSWWHLLVAAMLVLPWVWYVTKELAPRGDEVSVVKRGMGDSEDVAGSQGLQARRSETTAGSHRVAR